MGTIYKTTIMTHVKEYILMLLGVSLYAFGVIACILPAKCISGGAAGLALLIYYLTGQGFPIGASVFLINAILLLVAGFIIGWKFGIKTIFGIVMLSVMMWVWEWAMPFIATANADGTLDLFKLDNRLLSVVLGGIFCGIGVALCLMEGGSTGGVDILAMIINKFRTVSYGRVLMTVDFTIIGSSYFVANLGIDSVIYGYIIVAVIGYTVDAMMSGNQQSNQILIFTRDYTTMADAISEQAHRGVTVMDSMGWYSKENGKVVMVVCRKRESGSILKLAREIDPNAFISVGSVMGVYGKGFETLSKI